MIPLKLHIKNFLSYGPIPQLIDFSHYPLICLSGKNGHGKSALLEAITWALWGQARKVGNTVKPDQGLVRLGQNHMMVTLDFILNGQCYRVRREFIQSQGKATAQLEFGIIKQDGTIISLTDKTIRETQEKLEQTIHLDYESFVNSAFLRQGQANEFSKKSAKERKEVLAAILGVSRYEQLKRKALEHVKNAGTQLQAVTSYQTKLHEELAQSGIVQEKITQAQQSLDGVDKKTHEQLNALARCTTERATLVEQEKKYELLTFQYKQLEQQQEEKIQELRATFALWRQTHKKILSLPDKNQLTFAQQELVKEIQLHQEKLQKQLILKEEYLKHQELLHILERKLHNNHVMLLQQKQLEHERALAEQKTVTLSNTELTKRLQASDAELKKITQESADIAKNLQQEEAHKKLLAKTEALFEKRKGYYQKWVTQANSLSTELAQLKQKLALSHETESPSCPLCEQNLSSSRKKFLVSRLIKDEHFLNHRINRLSILIKKLKQILIDQHKELSGLKKHQEVLVSSRATYENLIKQSEKLSHEQQTLHQELLLLQTKASSTEKLTLQLAQEVELITKNRASILESNNEYATLKKKLADIVMQGKSISYDAKQHETHQQELKSIDALIAECDRLSNQASRQQERSQLVERLCLAIRSGKKQLASILGQISPLKEIPALQKNLNAKEQDIQTILNQLKTEKEQLLQLLGSLKNQQEQQKQFEAEAKKQDKKITELMQIIDDYQTIAKAAGKDGIQALLIEEAIPEIEDEANKLLAKLTNNQAQLFIESVRDLKSGGTQETLDIKISDAMGIRSYEMFSGGEAFRIDFSLRIAISKLLARRAGTSLQTLIIDEGFGSQDEEGLSHLMDAMYKIQDDFAKVIIVSHLPSMKDQFPVHFLVEKLPNGSTVHILEQG